MSLATLSAAAFGSDPGLWPLPPASEPYALWLRAVACGGQGRYSSARADLDALRRLRPHPDLASLAHSTQGSFLRQLGWHQLARGADGRALAIAQGRESVADALIGLSADALGVGRFAASAALLQRVSGVLEENSESDGPSARRLPVRHAWVSAELAMVMGDGPSAVRHAQRAVELAAGFVWLGTEPSARHRAKSSVVLAAALCSAGRLDEARSVADCTLVSTGQLGLIPLRWALASLASGIGSPTYTPEEVVALRDACADTVRRRGGRWSDR